MKKVLGILAVAALAVPALAAPGDKDFFQATTDGSWALYRSAGSEEMGNSGIGSLVRLGKANQDMGWMSFYGATGDTSASIANFVATKAGGNWNNVQAKLYFRTNGNASTGALNLISVRAGNVGGLVEDGNTSNKTKIDVGAGYPGSSQNVAFRGSPLSTATGFSNVGEGLYTGNVGDVGGEAWIAPAGRMSAGRNGNIFVAGDKIRYNLRTTPDGKYDGFNQDGAQGANFWAVEDLIGLRQNNGTASGGAVQVYDAGQILVGGQAAPTVFGLVNPAFNAADVRNNTAVANWKAIDLDMAFIMDIALNTENKGLAFTSQITGAGGVTDWSNTSFYTKESGSYAPYIALEVVPEPATMCLLALGGLALLRRRD